MMECTHSGVQAKLELRVIKWFDKGHTAHTLVVSERCTVCYKWVTIRVDVGCTDV